MPANDRWDLTRRLKGSVTKAKITTAKFEGAGTPVLKRYPVPLPFTRPPQSLLVS